MPSWARPSDVSFDEAAATAAVEAIAALRFTVNGTWISEESAADSALAGWDGLAAGRFAASLRVRQSSTGDAAIQLLRLQRAIEDSADDARLQQGRVERLQAQWDMEDQASRNPQV